MSTVPSKKRKIDYGNDDMHYASSSFISSWFGYFTGRRVDSSSHNHRNDQFMQQTLSHLESMTQMMRRMEEKLDVVEKRCEQLETKCCSLENKLESNCSSLENKLETQIHLVKDHVERLEGKVDKFHLSHDYNAMLLKNQSWEYSAEVIPTSAWLANGHCRDSAECLESTAQDLKDVTICMRKGEFTFDRIDIGHITKVLCVSPELYTRFRYDDELLPHWEEFAAAIKQFAPVINMLSNEYETSFEIYEVSMDYDTLMMIKDALIGVPFTKLSFDTVHFDDELPMDAYIAILETNQQLRRFDIRSQNIQIDDIERFCSAVHNHNSLVELDLFNSIGDSETGNAMIRGLLAGGDLKLLSLHMGFTSISSDVSTILAGFLETNPKLRELDLRLNRLNDNDVALIANALRHNTTLRQLYLFETDMTSIGLEAFRPLFCDNSSLNAVADSNHYCHLPEFEDLHWNSNTSSIKENRGRKIYALLSSRHLSGSLNVQHFSDIDVKVLPDMLEAVQRYAGLVEMDTDEGVNGSTPKVGCLSIVYEVMRKWEKVFNFYESQGLSSI